MTLLSGLPFDVFLEIVVCVFLAATIAYCAMLDRRLRAMRSGQDGLRELVGELNTATQRAVSAIDGLKQASEATNEELGERVRTARTLADELSLMVEAGNSIADKLGRTERPSAPRTPVQAAAPRSTPQAPSPRDAAVAARAANQLLEALKKKAR
ncbi:DUF6468 domain-containing protein [Parvibaculum sp.]|jgi:hypothetical protein|uniref:DUF6468 domain-containing protein n=1 Tax=Parvibaculum sp. TaxID=2024848 RepID=UPI001B2A87D3|nr:DUF6468 domain-containing protein [Parvibaculum sp.]MBO6634701.1 hypothetical protein [Parvibaculum sp.]MBO6679898.1 hypothetical protein [Parvibaculum sp.]MBO6684346.1 hypothetical protein [Parvibaculum sp.]MBO6903636.1 hypothetical protein [Parvibaculum sp.]